MLAAKSAVEVKVVAEKGAVVAAVAAYDNGALRKKRFASGVAFTISWREIVDSISGIERFFIVCLALIITALLILEL